MSHDQEVLEIVTEVVCLLDHLHKAVEELRVILVESSGGGAEPGEVPAT